MAASKDRENFVYIAKLAEQAERYDEMVDAMTNVAKLDVELTIEERNLLYVGYKNVIGARRASWRILSSVEQKEEAKGHELNVKRIKAYRQKVESELSTICGDIMTVIDEHLIPSSSGVESTVFFYDCRKGDYYRYLAEFKSGNERKEAADESMKAYQAATNAAESDLSPTHPVRLGLALNFSVFYYEILNSPERACHLAKQAFDEVISKLDTLSEESYKDRTLIMQLLRDNLTLWTSDITEDGAQIKYEINQQHREEESSIAGRRKMSSISGTGSIHCNCGKRAHLRTSWTNDNPGRRFHGCQNWKRGGCNFFVWEDPPMCSRAMSIIPSLKRKLSSLEDEYEKLAKENKKLKSYLGLSLFLLGFVVVLALFMIF